MKSVCRLYAHVTPVLILCLAQYYDEEEELDACVDEYLRHQEESQRCAHPGDNMEQDDDAQYWAHQDDVPLFI